MPRGDNVKRYWSEIKKKAAENNKNVWSVINPTELITLKNRITINSIVYQGTVSVKPDLAATLKYIDYMAEKEKQKWK